MTVPAGVICAYPFSNAAAVALSGWPRETTLDTRYLKMIATTTTAPGLTGGTDAHLHTSAAHGHTMAAHGHTWPNNAFSAPPISGANARLGSSGATNIANHNHAVIGDSPTAATASDGPNWSSTTDYVPFLLTIFIRSDGTSAGFPPDAILYASATPPSGWAIADGTAGTFNAVNRMLRGPATSGDGGTVGGTGDVHQHTQTHVHAQTHTHALTHQNVSGGTDNLSNVGGGWGTTLNPHSHLSTSPADATATSSATDTSTASNLAPPWQKVIPVQNRTGGPSNRMGLIAWWLGSLASIPAPIYQLCDGTLGTPNLCVDKYVMGAANVGEAGTTGGATTHIHSGAGHLHANANHLHDEGASGFGATTVTGPTFGINNEDTHNHGSGGNSSSVAIPNTTSVTPTVAAATNAPTFGTVAFIQLMVEEGIPQIMMSD